MTEIVTLAEAKSYLRVDHTDEHGVIATLISAATEAVLEVADAWDAETPVPGRIKLAVLARVAESFDKRHEAPKAANEVGLILPYSSFSTGAE